jgi:DNA-binding transcriptional LysR family regulator
MPDPSDALDLNALVALEALLREKHVTRAARRLGVAQSSLSHTLARLRETLGDQLLVRTGRGMVLTPRAEELAVPLAKALQDLRGVVGNAGPFDPATTSRAFGLMCPDLLAPLLPNLLSRMSREAPHARLEISRAPGDIPSALSAGARDLALSATFAEAPGLVQRGLGQVTFCAVARRKHPALARGKALTPEAWQKWPHVVVRTGSANPNFVGEAFTKAGLPRSLPLTVPSFLIAPFVVAETDHLFAGPRELLAAIARKLDLVLCDLPVPLPPLPVVACWHETVQRDPGHKWFRDLVIEILSASLKPRRGRGSA